VPTEPPETELDLLVSARTPIADGVILLTLKSANGGSLPPWEPGAHIDFILRPDMIRQYSLCGISDSSTEWEVAVQLESSGRGGSQYIFDNVHPGVTVVVRGPRNHFPLRQSSRYIFVAGGIGVTPLRAMLRTVIERGNEWSLLYGGRSTSTMGFADELYARDPARVILHPQDQYGMLDLEAAIGSPQLDTLVYCCGPEPLLRAVEEIGARWPSGMIRIERFSARNDNSADSHPFEVTLARSGVTLRVPSGRSILDVAREAGVFVPSSCAEGTCGTCETGVLEGVPDHRDAVLDEAERASNEVMMICVSRSLSPGLVLDL
jgi:ferredoxin-NADP reductase